MADFKKLSLSECTDMVLSAKDPLIMMHARPDGDTVSSCAALSMIFARLGERAKYICYDSIPQRLEFLLCHMEPADKEELGSRTLITVDIASPAQTGGFSSELPVPYLMIDHHAVGEPFADNYVVAGASSCAEVIMQIAEELERRGRLFIDRELAVLLYAGISSDTGGFRYSNTSPATMRRAAVLMELGIDHADINHKLFSSRSFTEIKAEGVVSGKINTALNGRVAYAVIRISDMDSIGAAFSDFECAVDVVRTVRGAEIAFVAKEVSEGEYRVSLRSVGMDVASVARRFGGGGHIRAAGCSVAEVKGLTVEKQVLSAIQELCNL